MDEYKFRKDFIGWLDNRAESVRDADARLIAARCALRCVPVLVTALKTDPVYTKKEMLLPTLRASAVALAVALDPARLDLLRASVLRAHRACSPVELTDGFQTYWYRGTPDLHPFTAQRAQWTAWHAARSAASVSQKACDAALESAVHALYILSSIATRAENTFHEALQADMNDLICSVPHQSFGQRSLWPNGFPPEVSNLWESLSFQLDNSSESWSCWTGWYKDVLTGNPRSSARAFEIALIPDLNWSAGFNSINLQVSQFPGWSRTPKVIPPKPIVAMSIRHAADSVSEAALAYAHAVRERISELEERLTRVNDPDTESKLLDELTGLHGDLELAKQVAEQVTTLPADPPAKDLDAVADKALSLAERIDKRVRHYVGKRATGVGNLLWVGAGTIFLMSIGIPATMAVSIAGVSLAVGNLGKIAENASTIADAVAKAKQVPTPNGSKPQQED